MHALSVMVGVFGASIWDMTQNHGAMARFIGQLFAAGMRSLGVY